MSKFEVGQLLKKYRLEVSHVHQQVDIGKVSSSYCRMSDGCDTARLGGERRAGQERAGNEGQQIPDSSITFI